MLRNFFNFFFLYCKISLQDISNFGITIFFYISTVCLFPLCLGDYFFNNILLISSTLWINIILAILLTLDNIYKNDYNNGVLDYLVIYPEMFKTLIIVKTLVYWITVILPLIIITPIFGVIFGLNFFESFVLFLSLLLGTPSLIVLGTLGVSLTITLRKSGLLLSLLVLPLYIPILIFGTSCITVINYGCITILANLMLLVAFIIFSFLFLPYIIILGLKIGITT